MPSTSSARRPSLMQHEFRSIGDMAAVFGHGGAAPRSGRKSARRFCVRLTPCLDGSELARAFLHVSGIGRYWTSCAACNVATKRRLTSRLVREQQM